MTALIRLEGISHRYGDEPVLDGIDLTIEPGSFTGIVGPSGAGKTTLLKAMLGTLQPTTGTVRRRHDLTTGYVPQIEGVDWTFPVTVREVALMGRHADHRGPWTSRSERQAVSTVLDQLGLAGLDDRHIRELSGGQQQRVFVARALLQGADLLVLDEPTAGVDVRTRHELLHLLADLHRTGRVTIVLTTHDLNGLAAHLPHLVCLNRRIEAAGTPIDVLTADTLERTFGASMDVLVHAGLPVVLDAHHRDAPGEHRHGEPHAHLPSPGPVVS